MPKGLLDSSEFRLRAPHSQSKDATNKQGFSVQNTRSLNKRLAIFKQTQP